MRSRSASLSKGGGAELFRDDHCLPPPAPGSAPASDSTPAPGSAPAPGSKASPASPEKSAVETRGNGPVSDLQQSHVVNVSDCNLIT